MKMSEFDFYLEDFLPYFEKTPSRLASISYQKAMIEESKGNIQVAHKYASESLQYAKETGNSVLVAQTVFNLAHFEFKLTNLRGHFKGWVTPKVRCTVQQLVCG